MKKLIIIILAAAFEQSDANFDQLCCEGRLYLNITLPFLFVLQTVIGSSIKDIEKRVNSSEAYLSKLISVLKRHYCIRLSSVNDCMAVVERETTLLSTSLLEEIASEVKSKIAKKSIEKLKNTLRKEALCSIPFEEPSCLTTVETLSIAMTYDPDILSFAETENILSNIFGSLFDDVVRWHGIDEEGIVCYFPPIYATIVIDRILKRFSFCKMKQIKTITVGYLSVYDEFLYDEVNIYSKILHHVFHYLIQAYQTLVERIDALEERNLELEKRNKTLSENIKELQRKIAGQSKFM